VFAWFAVIPVRITTSGAKRPLVRRCHLWANLEEQEARTAGLSSQGILEPADMRKPAAGMAVQYRRPRWLRSPRSASSERRSRRRRWPGRRRVQIDGRTPDARLAVYAPDCLPLKACWWQNQCPARAVPLAGGRGWQSPPAFTVSGNCPVADMMKKRRITATGQWANESRSI
jgi:hypothetical protein